MAPSPRFLSLALLALSALLLLISPSSALPRPQTSEEDGTHWVDLWASMPQLTEPNNLPPAPYASNNALFKDATLRQTVYITLPADQIRIRISNAFGNTPLPITAVTVALPGSDGAAGVKTIQVDTLNAVTFDGKPSITVPAGGLVVSDPIDFSVEAQSNLAVSIYSQEGQSGQSITGHPGSRTTSWFAGGDHVSKESLDSGMQVQSAAHW